MPTWIVGSQYTNVELFEVEDGSLVRVCHCEAQHCSNDMTFDAGEDSKFPTDKGHGE